MPVNNVESSGASSEREREQVNHRTLYGVLENAAHPRRERATS